MNATPPAHRLEDRSIWHAMSVSEVAAGLETDLTNGLDTAAARVRLESYGPNELATEERWIRLKRLVNQFRDVLVWLLLVAAGISGLVLNAWTDALAITAIVVLNAAIGYAQESRAQSALNRLRDIGAPDATVVRDGVAVEVPARELVPGDLLLVEAGDLVPADARVVSSVRLLADEAPLTGESMPVGKIEDASPEDAVMAERSSMLYSGTSVIVGRGRAVVTATGMDTEMGVIASLFSEDQPQTPLQTDLARIGRRLAVLAIGAAVVIFGSGLVQSFPIETMALTAVALAIAAIPEGLPAVITVGLAAGLQRMAHRNAIVRRLPAVEALGAVHVICTDKTGTLTAPELEVGEMRMAGGRHGLDLLTTGDPATKWLTASAALCNNAYRTADGWAGDPTEKALTDAVERQGVNLKELEHQHPRIDEAGFDGRRKRMSTLHRDGEGFVLLVKGAPEVLIARSIAVAGDEETTLSESGRQLLLRDAETLAARGMRTLAFAFRRLDHRPDDPALVETDLTFLGLAGLHEKIRPEVPSAVLRARQAGVTTVMVTGDHATTAAAVADSVGIGGDEVVDGRELTDMTVDDLTESITEHRVFARVDPKDKVKIIRAWQAVGAKVAMTGDGVNDSPALHRADIGVAMGSGTDVARESAAMVLTDDNYATIVAAIAEGRRLFNNVRNVVHFLLSANVSEVVYVLIGFVAFGFLGEPLLAVQLLWINLVTDALPAIALGMDRPTRDLMKDQPGQGRDVLSPGNMVLLLTQGAILAAATVLTMAIGTFGLGLDHASVQTMVMTTLVFSQLLHALNVRSGPTSGATGSIRPGPLMIAAIAGSSLLQLALVYTNVGNTIFRTVPLSLTAIGWTVVASILSMILVRILNVATSKAIGRTETDAGGSG